MTAVRDTEVMTVGPREMVITFVTDVDATVTTRVGDHETSTTGRIHLARFGDLEPDTAYDVDIDADLQTAGRPGRDPFLPARVRTLPEPAGARLATIATVNDVHFGETECGRIDGVMEEELGPVLRAEPGEPPYPETMNRAAIREIGALDPDAVLVKGDLTNRGTDEEYAAFLDAYGALGARMHHVRGNHDAMIDASLAVNDAPFVVQHGGVTFVMLDTVTPGIDRGRVLPEQLAYLDDCARDTSGAVYVFGHHHVWDLEADHRSHGYFGIDPDGSEALAAVVRRHENIVGYFAGHTHRHRVRRFEVARHVPFVEVGCTKDYPGVWAEYRIHEHGFAQVVHRIAAPDALEWTERTRPMFAGLYRDYALGPLEHRCFTETW